MPETTDPEKIIMSPTRWAGVLKRVRQKNPVDILNDLNRYSFPGIPVSEALQALLNPQVYPGLSHYEIDEALKNSSFGNEHYQIPIKSALQLGPDLSGASSQFSQSPGAFSGWVKVMGESKSEMAFGSARIVFNVEKVSFFQDAEEKEVFEMNENWNHWALRFEEDKLEFSMNASNPKSIEISSDTLDLKRFSLQNYLDESQNSPGRLHTTDIAFWEKAVTWEQLHAIMLHGVSPDAEYLNSYWEMNAINATGMPTKLSIPAAAGAPIDLALSGGASLTQVRDFTIPNSPKQ